MIEGKHVTNMHTYLRRALVVVCVSAMALFVLAGCASRGEDSAQEAQKANRAYMSQINETMESLKADLDDFVDAVSRDDIVNMRKQADNAFKRIDQLKAMQSSNLH